MKSVLVSGPRFSILGLLEPRGVWQWPQKHPQKYWLVIHGDERTLIEQVTSELWDLVSQLPLIASEPGRKETTEAHLP